MNIKAGSIHIIGLDQIAIKGENLEKKEAPKHQ